MQYIIVFLEGIITFISPCLLPLLPLYLSYFTPGAQRTRKAAANAFGFVLGFTLVFVSMGAIAGTVGSLFRQYATLLHLVTGLIVVLFGLNFLGILPMRLFPHARQHNPLNNQPGFLSSILFGIVFSISWTPCVGAFLGSALLLAGQQGTIMEGMLMLLSFSAGLGVPFMAAALLIDRLKGTFDFIKNHYGIINTVCGILLILMGLLMMSGYMGYVLSLLTI